jgi:hypothetical protein
MRDKFYFGLRLIIRSAVVSFLVCCLSVVLHQRKSIGAKRLFNDVYIFVLISARLLLWTRNYRQLLTLLKIAEEMEKTADLLILNVVLHFWTSSQDFGINHLLHE